ncbi:MAG: hypothetical protein ACFFAJ_05750 [Candidatus Hodarchaeota archaeon]
MIFSRMFGKYWFLQGFIICIIGSYIVGMGLGIFVVFNSIQSSESSTDTVSILMIIESKHPDYSFNYSYRSEVPYNLSLIEHLNNTIGRENWDGKKYAGGWFIQRIFNASESGSWFWLIYYRIPKVKNWSLASVGASSFILNQDYDIKFIFDHN